MNQNSRFRILPYKQGSASAKALAQALGGKVLRLEGSSYKPKAGDTIINWGCTEHRDVFDYETPTFFNYYSDLKKASNKKLFFEMMKEKGHEEIIPAFWTDKDSIPQDAYPIVCRTVLAGHSGEGIVIASSPDALVPAPLYVLYVKKEDEYRVHCGKTSGEAVIIAVQKKARASGFENPNWQVRNHANGFIYKRSGINPPESVLDVAKTALAASGLDFGAVDVIYNRKKGKAFVLEINTAPGLEGQTIEDYATFFKGGTTTS